MFIGRRSAPNLSPCLRHFSTTRRASLSNEAGFAPRARFCAPISKAICQGVAGRINISGATHGLVKDFFDCEFRGKVASKHKGEIDMYFVNRIRRELSIDAEGRTPNEEFLQLYSLLGLPRPVGQTNLVTVVETEKSQTTDLASENS